MRAVWALTIALLVAGCTFIPQPGPRDVSGPTDGYEPTASYLKVFVRQDDGNQTLVDFDRRDWYAAGIANALDDKTITFVTVHGMEREAVLGEVVVDSAKAPDALAGMRYDAMHATAQQRSVMDAEYERLLQKLVPGPAPGTGPASLPNVP